MNTFCWEESGAASMQELGQLEQLKAIARRVLSGLSMQNLRKGKVKKFMGICHNHGFPTLKGQQGLKSVICERHTPSPGFQPYIDMRHLKEVKLLGWLGKAPFLALQP